MSFKLMAKALDIKTGSPLTKLILLKLCDNANDQGECWPSQEGIAEQCETSRETVNRHIKKLAGMGLLSVLSQTKHGMKTVSKYKINLSDSRCDSGSQRCDGRSQPDVTENHIEPIIEPTIEENNKRFEEAWAAYGRHGVKNKAWSYWKKLNDSQKDEIEKAIPGYLNYLSQETWQKKKQFEGWINPANQLWTNTANQLKSYKENEYLSNIDCYLDREKRIVYDSSGGISTIYYFDTSIGAVSQL